MNVSIWCHRIEADSKASNALLWYFLRRQLSLRRMGSPTVEMLSMLAIEELRRGRFWPTSSGSRSLKSLVATGVGALHGRGPQMRPRVKNGLMMDAQDGRGEICILFLWKRVRVGGLWKRCASSPAGSGNGGPRSCRVGGLQVWLCHSCSMQMQVQHGIVLRAGRQA